MTQNKKRSRKTTTKWHLFFSYFGIAYAIISGIFLVPLYLKHIPVELYGAWLASGNVLAWLAAFDLGIGNLVVQRVGASYGRNDPLAVGGFATAGIVLCAGLGLFIAASGVLLAPRLPELVELSQNVSHSELSGAFLLATMGTALSILSFGLGGVNRGLQASLSVGIIQVAGQTIALIAIFAGVLLGYGIYALAFGILARPAVDLTGNICILLYRAKMEELRPAFRPYYFKDFGAMLGFTSLGKFGLTISDRIDGLLIARMMGPELVPVFTLTRRGMDVAQMILLRPGNALAPAVSHLKGEGKVEEKREIFLRFFRILFWFSGLGVAGFLALNQQFVGLWVGSELYAGSGVNVALVGLFFAGVIFRNMSQLCTAMGDIRNIALSGAIRAVLTVLLMIIGIRHFGLLGAACAPLIGLLLVTAPYALWSFSKNVKFDKKDMVAACKSALYSLTLGCGVGFLGSYFNGATLSSFFVNSLLVCFIYFALLFVISSSFRLEAKAAFGMGWRQYGRFKSK